MTATAQKQISPIEYTDANLWNEWFPEAALADLLAGRDIEPDIGQVRGAWKAALEREVRAGRLVKWKGHWYPVAGASFGLGPLKTCYGTAEARDAVLSMGLRA
jgi:hypothetical protein